MLEQQINKAKEKKSILLMTHLVLGYPSFEVNRAMIAQMDLAKVELIELQIPFSEPSADGPVINKANQVSLANGTRVEECFQFAKEMAELFPEISFLFMTYYNILFSNGVNSFVEKAKKIGIKGLIVPDLPPEEASEYLEACESQKIDPIFIFTPTSQASRLEQLSKISKGFIYCVARRGVTGTKTKLDDSLQVYIDQYRKATQLPLALGFGIQSKEDVDYLKNKVEIAVIGSKLISLQEEKGIPAVGDFLNKLRI